MNTSTTYKTKVIFKRTTSEDANGAPIWSVFYTEYANVKYGSATESFSDESARRYRELTADATLRKTAKALQLTNLDKAQIGANEFDILAVCEDENEVKIFLKTCK